MRLLLNNRIELTLEEALQLLGGYGRGAAALGSYNSVLSMVTMPRLCSTYTPALLAGGDVLAGLYRLVRVGAAREAMRPRAKLAPAPAKQAPRAKLAATPAKHSPAKQAPKQEKSQVTRRPTICGSGKRRMKKSHG